MSNFTPILAEIVDKEPTLATLWLVASVLSVASFLACRSRRWPALIAVPLIAVWAFALISELHSADVGPAIVHELGRSYVIQSYIAAFVPLLFVLFSLSRNRTNVA
jgi:hypothetical protein